jgi:diacylglycerol kinase (ATP)
MKHLFIINPTAGKGKASAYVPKIEELFKDMEDEYVIEFTEGPGHATEIAGRYASQEDYRIYAIGGDGTLNEVLNGMVGTNSSLGLIPGGSGNDFIRSIYNKKVGEDILIKTIRGSEKTIDLGRVGDRYFINIASIGIDAEIGYNAAKFKKIPLLPGYISYYLSIFYTLILYKNHNVQVSVDGETSDVKTLLCAIANGKYYGGGMKIAPEADLTDGLFDVCHIRNLSKLRILFLFPKVIKGKHAVIPEVSFKRAERVGISSDEYITLNLDGEFEKVKSVQFEIVQKAVKVIIPQD